MLNLGNINIKGITQIQISLKPRRSGYKRKISAVKMDRRGTSQQLYSILVANMNRLSHLQLFGREHLEKRAHLKKLQSVDFINYTIK